MNTETTRTGKIARLPLNIREELNRRLDENQTSGAILSWLNNLPELANAEPITAQNLSNWRHGGYQDWVNEQECRQRAQDFAANSKNELLELNAGQLANQLATLWLIDYTITTRTVLATMTDPVERLELLRKSLHLVHDIRQQDIQVARLAWEKERRQAQPAPPSSPIQPNPTKSNLEPVDPASSKHDPASRTPVSNNPPPGSKSQWNEAPPAQSKQIQPNPTKSKLETVAPQNETRNSDQKDQKASPQHPESSIQPPTVGTQAPATSNFVKWDEQERLEKINGLPVGFNVLPWSPDHDVAATDILERKNLDDTYEIVRTAGGILLRPQTARI